MSRPHYTDKQKANIIREYEKHVDEQCRAFDQKITIGDLVMAFHFAPRQSPERVRGELRKLYGQKATACFSISFKPFDFKLLMEVPPP